MGNREHTVTPTLLTQAEHARRCGVSRKSVTAWKHSGLLVMVGDRVDFDRSYRGERWKSSVRGLFADERAAPASRQAGGRSGPITVSRGEVLAELQRLDWSTPWSPASVDERLRLAAALVGLEPVTSTLRDDGHWGGFQLRERDAGDPPLQGKVVLGYGYEVSAFDVLDYCRDFLAGPDDTVEDLDDTVEVCFDQLHLLAYPFADWHTPSAR